MKVVHVVEAALFSAGRALSVEEICERTGLEKRTVTKAVGALQKAYADRDTVLEVGKAGAKWAMQVRRQAAEPAAKFAPMEIPAKTLKTLALIAYHQPIKQSDLCDMVGPRVYDHVPELKERGLVKTRKEGQTKIITTTAAFPEYFGLDAATPEQIRVALAKAVGLDPAAEARKAASLESYGEAPETRPAADEEEADGGSGTADEAPPDPTGPPTTAADAPSKPAEGEGTSEPAPPVALPEAQAT